MLSDKDARGVLEALEPVLTLVVITTELQPRALAADELGALAAEVFGDDRVLVEPALADALDRAIELAEADSELGGSGVGVLVTGSVVTAGEARRLLGG